MKLYNSTAVQEEVQIIGNSSLLDRSRNNLTNRKLYNRTVQDEISTKGKLYNRTVQEEVQLIGNSGK